MMKITVMLLGLFIAVIEATPLSSTLEPITSLESCATTDNTIASSVNHVAFSLAKGMGEPGNMFFSPLGVSMALGMAYFGARGETAEQMDGALGYTASGLGGQKVHEAMTEICENVVQRSANGQYHLDIANAVFNQVGLDIDDNFVKGIEAFYHADAMSLDFANKSQEATDAINEWAKERTAGEIETFLGNPLPADTEIVLTNAIYFKGTWEIQFPVDNSFDGYFYVPDKDQEKRVQMMILSKEYFRYLQDEETGYKYIELPYKGGQVSMVLALPIKVTQPADLEMTSDVFCRINSSMVETEMDTVMIPKFKIQYEKSLKDALTAMGIRDAFQPGAADFSGMKPSNGIFLSDVVQKAVIEVDERGSKAAAVSGLLFMPVSVRQVDEFVANHPFLFYIVDKATGAMLFSGRVADP